MRKTVTAKVLFLIAVVSFTLRVLFGTDSIVGASFGVLADLTLLLAIIAAVREYRAKRAATTPNA